MTSVAAEVLSDSEPHAPRPTDSAMMLRFTLVLLKGASAHDRDDPGAGLLPREVPGSQVFDPLVKMIFDSVFQQQ
jgi:hypothetical protein